MTKTLIQPRVDARVYRAFKCLCRAHGVVVERAIEQAMRDILNRAGVELDEESEEA